MTYKYLFGAVVLAGAVQTASASEVFFVSENLFSVTVSDHSVSITQDPSNPSGPYNNGIIPMTSGDGVNDFSLTDEGYDNSNGATSGFAPGNGYVLADGDSYSLANGMASQFLGEAYSLIFTNNSAVAQTFTLGLTVSEELFATGYSKADAYGGWEINRYSTFGYFTNTLYGNGTSTSDYKGFTGGFVSGGGILSDYEGTASVTFTLGAAGAAGDTAQVQVWASGDTFAQSPAPTPEPFTLALCAGGLGLALARRRKSK